MFALVDKGSSPKVKLIKWVESGSPHVTRNICKRLGDYMGRLVLKGGGKACSHCEQLVVNYQALLYKKSIRCRAIPFNQLYFLVEKQTKTRFGGGV